MVTPAQFLSMTVPASLMSAFQTTRAPTTSNLESWPVIQQICFRPKRIRRVVSRADREGTPKATEVSRNPTYRHDLDYDFKGVHSNKPFRSNPGLITPSMPSAWPAEFPKARRGIRRRSSLRSCRVIKRDQKASASRTFAAESGCIAAHIGQLERDKVPVERLHPWPVAQKRTAELQQASNCPAHPN